MKKRRKSEKSKEKILSDQPEKNLDLKDERSKQEQVKKQIEQACEGLYFTSETDAEILPFFGTKAQAVTKEEILIQTKNAADLPVEEKDFTEFFTPLLEIQDWFGDEEKATVEKFSNLKNFLEKNYTDLKVFKIGKIQIDIYVVGIDRESNLAGITTKAVET